MSARREPAFEARARIDDARRRPDGSPNARTWRAVEALVWTALVFGVWMVTLSSIDTQDVRVACACSLAAGVLGAAGRWAIGGSWPLVPVVGKALARLPLAALLDSGAVIVNAFRRHGGHFTSVPLLGTSGMDPHAASRRVQATLLISYAPATYLLDIDERDGTALLHRTSSPAPSSNDAFSP